MVVIVLSVVLWIEGEQVHLDDEVHVAAGDGDDLGRFGRKRGCIHADLTIEECIVGIGRVYIRDATAHGQVIAWVDAYCYCVGPRRAKGRCGAWQAGDASIVLMLNEVKETLDGIFTSGKTDTSTSLERWKGKVVAPNGSEIERFHVCASRSDE